MSKGGDACWNIWEGVYKLKEFDFPPYARVLEIGCAELDWMSLVLESTAQAVLPSPVNVTA